MGNKTSAVLVSPDDSQAHSLTGSALARPRGVPVLIAGETLPAATRSRRWLVGAPSPWLRPRAQCRVGHPGQSAGHLRRAHLGRWTRSRVSVAVGGGLRVDDVRDAHARDPRRHLGERLRGCRCGDAVAVHRQLGDLPGRSRSSSRVASEPACHDDERAGSQLDDRVLGDPVAAWPGRPWSPPTAVPAPTSTSTRASTRTNASPEPVKKRSLPEGQGRGDRQVHRRIVAADPGGGAVQRQVQAIQAQAGKFKMIATGLRRPAWPRPTSRPRGRAASGSSSARRRRAETSFA